MKFYKKLSILLGSIFLVSVPIVATSCNSFGNAINNDNSSTNSTNNNISLNSNVNLNGDVFNIFGISGTNDEIIKNIENILLNNKEILLNNTSVNLDNINVKITHNNITNNNQWDETSFGDWSKELNSNNTKELEIPWEENINKNKITSIFDLQKWFNDNLELISTSIGLENIILENIQIQFDNNYFYIPFSCNNEKYLLKVKTNLFEINLDVNVKLILENSEITKTVNVSYKIDSSIKNKNLNSYNEIIFDELENSEDTINVHTYISDNDILNKLNWLSNESLNEEHVDGSDINLNNINMELLNQQINLPTSEKIDYMYIQMNERDPRKDGYNGTFEIIIKTSSTIDNNYFSKTYRYGNYQENIYKPLQLYVADAYVMKTINNLEIGPEYYPEIASFKDNKKFAVSSYRSMNVENINKGLKLPNTWNKFYKLFNETLSSIYQNYSYGINMSFDNYDFKNEKGSLFTFDLDLKQGFKFKNKFKFNKKEFNVDNQKEKAFFRIGVDGAFLKRTPVLQVSWKTVEDIEEFYKTHDSYNPDTDLKS